MEKGYNLCLKIINDVEELLTVGTDYKDIIEYLESKKIDVEVWKDACKDESSEYVDKLVKHLK